MVRIERHRVGEAAVSAVRKDFANRIGSQVHSMSKAGPVTAWEWWLIAQEFVEYLGALSVESPGDGTAQRRRVIVSSGGFRRIIVSSGSGPSRRA
ncbi:hypothetical protein [Streptomyces sp. SAI-149]|uniref:hypothetical protein n=1 Tax=Streptomyces sp. SAI-149 TaxID=2940542 RepID=UPI000FAC32AC|nr:hypothetical protein [Streptomyces sp. SAI-149]MDH6498290.1 hypothetical protein [Streptomyces sp. SAI-149]